MNTRDASLRSTVRGLELHVTVHATAASAAGRNLSLHGYSAPCLRRQMSRHSEGKGPCSTDDYNLSEIRDYLTLRKAGMLPRFFPSLEIQKDPA